MRVLRQPNVTFGTLDAGPTPSAADRSVGFLWQTGRRGVLPARRCSYRTLVSTPNGSKMQESLSPPSVGPTRREFLPCP